MSTASIPNFSGFQPLEKARLQFRRENGEIFIKNAYSWKGKSYDITYGTTAAEMQTLQRMDPKELIQSLQEQMQTGLSAAGARNFPEKVRFSSKKGRVYAWKNGERMEIGSQLSSLTGRTMKAMMGSLSKDHALLQSSVHSKTAPPPPRTTHISAPEASSIRLKIPDEFKKAWLDSEMALFLGGFFIGPLRFLAGLIQLLINLVAALFTENSAERLSDAFEGVGHIAMGAFSTIASLIFYPGLIIAIPFAIFITLIK